MHYNFARPHKPLGRGVTPAIAAGVAEYPWTVWAPPVARSTVHSNRSAGEGERQMVWSEWVLLVGFIASFGFFDDWKKQRAKAGDLTKEVARLRAMLDGMELVHKKRADETWQLLYEERRKWAAERQELLANKTQNEG